MRAYFSKHNLVVTLVICVLLVFVLLIIYYRPPDQLFKNLAFFKSNDIWVIRSDASPVNFTHSGMVANFVIDLKRDQLYFTTYADTSFKQLGRAGDTIFSCSLKQNICNPEPFVSVDADYGIASLAISPEGASLAYTVRNIDQVNDPNHDRIHIAPFLSNAFIINLDTQATTSVLSSLNSLYTQSDTMSMSDIWWTAPDQLAVQVDDISSYPVVYRVYTQNLGFLNFPDLLVNNSEIGAIVGKISVLPLVSEAGYSIIAYVNKADNTQYASYVPPEIIPADDRKDISTINIPAKYRQFPSVDNLNGTFAAFDMKGVPVLVSCGNLQPLFIPINGCALNAFSTTDTQPETFSYVLYNITYSLSPMIHEQMNILSGNYYLVHLTSADNTCDNLYVYHRSVHAVFSPYGKQGVPNGRMCGIF